jgi:ABC-type sugar transport system ATPase subunit
VKLFLFDEPSASLDAAATGLLVSRVAALRARGCAILFTTHLTHDLDVIATRVERIEDGRCVGRPIARNDEVAEAIQDGPLSDDAAYSRLCRPFARA